MNRRREADNPARNDAGHVNAHGTRAKRQRGRRRQWRSRERWPTAKHRKCRKPPERREDREGAQPVRSGRRLSQTGRGRAVTVVPSLCARCAACAVSDPLIVGRVRILVSARLQWSDSSVAIVRAHSTADGAVTAAGTAAGRGGAVVDGGVGGGRVEQRGAIRHRPNAITTTDAPRRWGLSVSSRRRIANRIRQRAHCSLRPGATMKLLACLALLATALSLSCPSVAAARYKISIDTDAASQTHLQVRATHSSSERSGEERQGTTTRGGGRRGMQRCVEW